MSTTKPREFWITRDAVSKPCPRHAAVYTRQDLEAEGGTNEFIESGIHVISYDAFEAMRKERDASELTEGGE